MSRYAVIDIGSNSLKMYVGRIVHGRITDVDDISVINRLAEGLAETGELSEEAMDRTLEALKVFKARAEGLGAEKVAAVGTAALRRADNAREFVTMLRGRLKISLRVLSGEQEARCAYLAATTSLELGPDPVRVFDAGGASTEVVLGQGERVESAISLPIGSRVLTERHCKSDPVAPAEFEALADEVARVVADAPRGEGTLVGIGSTASSLGTVHFELAHDDHAGVHGRVLTRDVIETAVDSLGRMSLNERRRIPGLNPERADVMLAGASIAAALMSRCGAEELTICSRGLRHGVFRDRFA